MLLRAQKNNKAYMLLVETQSGLVTFEDNLELAYKT